MYCRLETMTTKKQKLIEVSIGTGEIEEGNDITEVMADDAGFAGQFHHNTCMDKAERKPKITATSVSICLSTD